MQKYRVCHTSISLAVYKVGLLAFAFFGQRGKVHCHLGHSVGGKLKLKIKKIKIKNSGGKN